MPYVKAHNDDNQEKRGTNNPVTINDHQYWRLVTNIRKYWHQILAYHHSRVTVYRNYMRPIVLLCHINWQLDKISPIKMSQLQG